MIYILISLAFVVGLITGISVTMQQVRKGIQESDILPEEKDFICEILGIRP